MSSGVLRGNSFAHGDIGVCWAQFNYGTSLLLSVTQWNKSWYLIATKLGYTIWNMVYISSDC
jgi:hypothetical protein